MELSNSKINLYKSLDTKKMRRRHGLFMVEGEKGVLDLLGKYELEALIICEQNPNDILKYLNCRNIDEERIYTVSARIMDRISSLSTPSSMVAVFRLPIQTVSDMRADDLCLMLDGVQDPGNLGTIIRTAHWFGIKKVFASLDTVDIYNPKTIQATMGSLASVEVVYAPLGDVLDANPGMQVYGLVLDGKDIYEASLTDRGFIVMGNEGKGISADIRQRITRPLLIPPYNSSNHSESLNVAIATGITLSIFRSTGGKRR